MKKNVTQANVITIGKRTFSKDGIWSCIFFLIGTIALIGSFWNSFWNIGQAGTIVGILGFFILIGSIIGLIFGIRGRKQKKCSHIIDEIGIASNVLLIIIIVILFVIGMGSV